MGRSILAVLAGMGVAFILILVVESVGHRVFPPPEGIDLKDPEALKVLMADAPAGALLFVLLAWGVGTLAGGWTAAWIAGRSPMVHALIVGALAMSAGIANMIMLPHPLWFWIVALLVFLPSAWTGARLAAGRAVS